MVRDTREQEDVRQARIDTAVGRSVARVEDSRLLRRMRGIEARVVVIAGVRKRYETLVGELEFAGFGNQRVRGDLAQMARIEIVKMDRQIRYQATGLRMSSAPVN
ncbi:hypothetical protein C8K18_1021 [Paraburkholderia sp. GV068]|nr:hypothetical protein C8K19_1021 [Paraburkholderia sp. GV072]PUB07595.1 hypothetical protein C8K18_1021 [Paraburkholderia sp. GV068]